MKVIRELIDYFTQSSVLSDEDLRQLRASGWSLEAGAGDLHLNSDGSVVRPKSIPESEDDTEPEDELDLTPALPSRRETTGPKLRASSARAEVLDEWLAERLPEWRVVVTGTLEALSPAGLRGLRELAPPEAAEVLRNALEDRDLTWTDLWDALLLGDFRDWFGQRQARGPATQAFRGLLRATLDSDVTKYRWLLRFPHIAETALIAGTQQALLRGMNHWLADDPEGIAEWIKKGKSLTGLLCLALAECARHFDPRDPKPPAGEFPPRPLPSGGGERVKVLNGASVMNPAQVVPFVCYPNKPWGIRGLFCAESYEELELRCPPSWQFSHPPREVVPPIPCRVRIDATMTCDHEERFFANAEQIRAVTSQFGICEMMVLPNRHVTSYCKEEFFIQVVKFTGVTARRTFCPAALQTMLAERAHLDARTGEAPCFHASLTHVRKEIVI